MKRIFTLIAMSVALLSASAKTLYLKTIDAWEEGDAQTAVWYWQGDGEGQWSSDMTKVSDHLWKVDIDGNFNCAIFVRHESGKAADWTTNNWGQTKPSDEGGVVEFGSNDMFTISGQVPNSNRWEGSWSVYDNNGGGNNDDNGGKDDKDDGDNNGGGNNKPDTSSDLVYYLRGCYNGADPSTPTAEEQFEVGMLKDFTFTEFDNGVGYFWLMECVAGNTVGDEYMAATFTSGVTSATMLKKANGGCEKFAVPAGTVTFYLYDNEDGTLELSTAPIAGKKLMGGVEQTGLQSVRYELNPAAPMYNILGAEVGADYKGLVIQNGHKFIRK